ncbi:unnamed protein product [Rhizopus stolonifer]
MSTSLNIYRQLLREVNRQELRELYSAIVFEQKKKIELSANRVGLNLPKEYNPDSPQPLN